MHKVVSKITFFWLLSCHWTVSVYCEI